MNLIDFGQALSRFVQDRLHGIKIPHSILFQQTKNETQNHFKIVLISPTSFLIDKFTIFISQLATDFHENSKLPWFLNMSKVLFPRRMITRVCASKVR